MSTIGKIEGERIVRLSPVSTGSCCRQPSWTGKARHSTTLEEIKDRLEGVAPCASQ